MQLDPTPANKHLIFIGGGHAHAIALLMMAMKKPAGVRITLISDLVQTPYSGMLPGLIAGHYSVDQAHIDLGRFCRYAGIDFIADTVTSIDPSSRTVQCLNHPDFHYDLLSIDTGSTPALSAIPGASEYTTGVKPVKQLLTYWDALQARIMQGDDNQEIHIGSVGGGASAVEILLAMQYKLQKMLSKQQRRTSHLHFHIICGPKQILSGQNKRVQQHYLRVLKTRNIELHTEFRVAQVKQGRVINAAGAAIELDEIIWATNARGADWPSKAGLECADNGCIKVNDYLQSVSHADIFATGDIAEMINFPRPKAGVFAVRQGAPLLRNLLAALAQQPLTRYKPQQRFLSLISTGDRYAVASRGPFSFAGAWVWRWKNHIDQTFMRRFSALTELPDQSPGDTFSIENPDMRCGGCGAKVGHSILNRVLKQLPQSITPIEIGLNRPDDAAVIDVPSDKLLVQSVDSFRQLVNDDFLFGQIAANHALGDIFAMGATPHSAQAIVSLPYASDDIIEQRLRHLLLGASKVFTDCHIGLIGGHTSEGSELTLGFTINGLADRQQLLTKQGLQPGDRLILTKPLGTGTLFASDMRSQAKGTWISTALQHMLQSNYKASQILSTAGAHACTDVTGFGLLGHLSEMLDGSNLGVRLWPDNLPVMDGALSCLRAGLLSSLHAQNRKFAPLIINMDEYAANSKVELLFDPQTAGGLLAAVSATQIDQVLAELHAAGYSEACVIGCVGKEHHTQVVLA
ncbi:selenide, water dikinase SelD [Amphritea sp. 1_MG-2023]|uniref:selenide, water dikinase SelD n=1 Tax=Amphritea sp. 1_MG-2023 TaxID=3062670 RepID=UPI0026E3C938|nr:selenide, water dikinase SelD [Amphritea sp. 1_MG-2023]MDO6564562.1 selenide, water dikinase SelD [Amphritea sp. 1_MG-2023]